MPCATKNRNGRATRIRHSKNSKRSLIKIVLKTELSIARHPQSLCKWLNSHSIDFNNAHVIGKGIFLVRKTWNPDMPQIQLNRTTTQNHYLDNFIFFYKPPYLHFISSQAPLFLLWFFLFTLFTVYISATFQRSRFLFTTCQRLQAGNQKLNFYCYFNQRMFLNFKNRNELTIKIIKSLKYVIIPFDSVIN